MWLEFDRRKQVLCIITFSVAGIFARFAQYAQAFLPGVAVGRLFDLGYFKLPYLISCCVLVACTFLTAEYVLVQGLAVFALTMQLA